MEHPTQPCPYKEDGEQCKKGWYMIPVLTPDNEVIYICPYYQECLKDKISENIPDE